jgi:hypothetical protein
MMKMNIRTATLQDIDQIAAVEKPDTQSVNLAGIKRLKYLFAVGDGIYAQWWCGRYLNGFV